MPHLKKLDCTGNTLTELNISGLETPELIVECDLNMSIFVNAMINSRRFIVIVNETSPRQWEC